MPEGSVGIDSVGMKECQVIRDDISIIGIVECFHSKALPVSAHLDYMGSKVKECGLTFIHPNLSASFSIR